MGSRSAFIVLPRVGEPGSPGPCRREGRRRVERTIDGKHGEGHEPYKPVHETAMDSQAEEAVRMLARSASDKGDERMIDSYGHPRLQSAKLSCEEPDAGNLHVRVCGGRGWQHPRLPGRQARCSWPSFETRSFGSLLRMWSECSGRRGQQVRYRTAGSVAALQAAATDEAQDPAYSFSP